MPLAALLSALLLSACASAPTPQTFSEPESVVPTHWMHAPDPSGDSAPTSTDLAQWWKRLDSPTLDGLVQTALTANADLRSARATLRQARATRDAAAAARWPSVNASASAQRSRSAGGTGSAATSATTNLFAAGLDASWELDGFGEQTLALQASEADTRAAGWALAQAQATLAAEVALAYADWWGYRNRLAIAQRNLATQESSLQITRWRVQAGLASALEQAQGQTALSQVRAQVPALQTSVALARHSLALLTGRHTDDLPELTQASPLSGPAIGWARQLPADVLRQRPDVQRSAALVEAAWARAEQADAARRPKLTLNATLGLKALTLGGLNGTEAVVHTLMAALSAPLFDAGAANAKVRAQQAGWEQARASHESALRTALKEVEDALASLQGEHDRQTHLQTAQASAQQAADLAAQRHRSGLVDYATVLDTERTLLSTQDALAASQATLLANHVRLFKALGGGWVAPAGDAPAP